MKEPSPSVPIDPGEPGPESRLDSWKAIAVHLGRDVSTVQRWEKREGMPVHRHLHDKIGSVYAYPAELDAWWQSRRQRLEAEPDRPPLPPAAGGRWATGWWRWLLGAAALAAAVALGLVLGTRLRPAQPSRAAARVHRLTDTVGLEESPAISPDGKAVAFASPVGAARQIFVRLIAGGPPLRITADASDHQFPRWLPDSSALVYFTPPAAGEAQGTVWEVPALGGAARKVAVSLSGADVASDGRIVTFRLADGGVELVACAADGSLQRVLARFAGGMYYRYPRWSPDGRWIAFQRGDGVRSDVFAVGSEPGRPLLQLSHDSTLVNGVAWLADGSGVVYSSSRGSTVPYLPALALWQVPLGGGPAVPVTTGEASYEQPDVHATGLMVASRLTMRSDVWSFPTDGPAAENARRGVRLTRQTGQVRTPTVDPTGTRVAFLSDGGGHANLWVMPTGTGELRQITHERDPAVSVGVPLWSPDGRAIAFVSSRGNPGLVFGLWLVNPDGSELRNVARHGWGAAWSNDGQWLYYVDAELLKKVPAAGGPPVTVRSEQVRNVIGTHGTTLYYLVERPLVDGRPEFQVRVATPEDAPSRVLARLPTARVASWQIVNPSLSPDGRWMALPLEDGFTTNVWALSTSTAEWRQVTDFGDATMMIARRVAWSSDGRRILAAVTEGDADVVLFEGLLPGGQ